MDRGRATAREGQGRGRDGPHGRRADGYPLRRAEAPIVGRDAELARLQEALDRARLRELQLVELVADPGVGKSRLVSELRARAVGFQQLEAAGEPYAKGQPYAAVRGLLRQLVGVTPEAPRDVAGAQLTGFVGSVLPELVPWLPLVAVPFDAAVEPTPETRSLDPAASRDRLHDSVATLLDRLLLMPSLIVVEDLHWLDDASHWLLAHLVARPAARPWLVVVTSRPGTSLLAADESPAARIDLAPLAEEAATALALATGDAALSEETVGAVVARAGGNPLFVRALVLAAAAGEAVDTLPETVESTLMALIDQLAPADRMLLRHAAVVGPTFEAAVVEEVLGDELEGGSRWDALGQFVLPDGETGFRFRHDLVRVTAYEGLSFRRRREIHAAVGAALERRANGREDEEAALLSLHFHEAGAHDKAWRYATIAGDGAAVGYSNVVAAGLYERALESAAALGSVPDEELARVGEALGDVYERFADFERSARAYDRALAAAGADRQGRARLGGKQAVLDEHAGRYDDAIARYDDALAELGDDDHGIATRADLELGRAGVLYRQSRYAESIDWAERAASHAELAGDPSAHAHALYLLGGALSDVGRDGIPELERAIAIYEELDDFVGAARSLNNIGVQRYAEGRWDESSAAYRASREARERAGVVLGTAIPMNNEAEILSDQGHLKRAEALFRDMVRICRAAGYTFGALVGLGNLARVMARTARFDEAHTLYDETYTGFLALGSERFALETRARVVECCVFAGAHARGLGSPRRAGGRGRVVHLRGPRGVDRAPARLRALPGAPARRGERALVVEPHDRPRARCDLRRSAHPARTGRRRAGLRRRASHPIGRDARAPRSHLPPPRAASLARSTGATMRSHGDVAEWLGRGLQSLVQRFESARRLRCLGASRRRSTSPATRAEPSV